MKRHGAVITFREGVTPAQAGAALKKIADVIDAPVCSTDLVPDGQVFLQDLQIWKNKLRINSRPFRFTDLIEEFDDEMGGPVWYIP
jgi:hypothetical protein